MSWTDRKDGAITTLSNKGMNLTSMAQTRGSCQRGGCYFSYLFWNEYER
jgi:hypothetical protein